MAGLRTASAEKSTRLLCPRESQRSGFVIEFGVAGSRLFAVLSWAGDKCCTGHRKPKSSRGNIEDLYTPTLRPVHAHMRALGSDVTRTDKCRAAVVIDDCLGASSS